MAELVPAVIKVGYPNMRLQVLSSLENLADRAYQQRVWVEGILPHPGYGDDFALAYGWLYEDLPIMDDPPDFIGTVLRDEVEAEAMPPLKRAIDRLHEELGYNGRTDAEYMASPLWDDVILTTGAALAAMRRPDGEVMKPARTVAKASSPDWRGPVVGAVEHLSDRNYQQRAWIEGTLPYPSEYSFAHAYNCLFEDIAVMDDPFDRVGDVLRDAVEARALLPLKRAIERLHEAMGYNRTDAEYLASPLWDDVVAAAGQALATLQRPDGETGVGSVAGTGSDTDPGRHGDAEGDDVRGQRPDTGTGIGTPPNTKPEAGVTAADWDTLRELRIPLKPGDLVGRGDGPRPGRPSARSGTVDPPLVLSPTRHARERPGPRDAERRQPEALTPQR